MARLRKRERTGFGDVAAWAEPAAARPFVNRRQLLQQALSLLEETGFDGLTMRRLAERLGVQAASLYNHVRDKEELLALLADTIIGNIQELDTRLPWRERLEAAALDYRRVLLAHHDAARVVAATPPVGPMRLRIIEQVLCALREGGLSDDEAAKAAFVFNSFATGFVLDETQGHPRADQNTDEVQAQIRNWYSALPPDRYPNLVALAEQLGNSDMDLAFRFGLTALLDGLELRLAQRQPS